MIKWLRNDKNNTNKQKNVIIIIVQIDNHVITQMFYSLSIIKFAN